MTTPSSLPKFSIIFPCYNESHSIEKLIQTLQNLPKNYSIEFIIVENGSTDSSRKILKNLHLDKNFKLIYIDKNQGYGYGIQQGIKVAQGEYVGWMHSDLQYSPSNLAKFFNYINDHPKEKLLLKGKRQNRKLIDRLFTFCMGIFDSLLFRCHMHEIMSSPTIATHTLFKNIDHFPQDFSIDIYVYALAKRQNLQIVHLPIHLHPRKTDQSSWNSGLKSRFKMSKTLIKDSFKISCQLHKDA